MANWLGRRNGHHYFLKYLRQCSSLSGSKGEACVLGVRRFGLWARILQYDKRRTQLDGQEARKSLLDTQHLALQDQQNLSLIMGSTILPKTPIGHHRLSPPGRRWPNVKQ